MIFRTGFGFLSVVLLGIGLSALVPHIAHCSLSEGLDASDPAAWTYELDPGVGLKAGMLFTPSDTNGSNAQSVAGPLGSFRFTVYDGAGTLFAQVDSQFGMVLNTPVSAAFLAELGGSAGYRFRRHNIKVWFGLSYGGFLNLDQLGGGVARVGMSKSITDKMDIELEASFFYANPNVPTGGTVNYEFPALEAVLSFPIDLGRAHKDID